MNWNNLSYRRKNYVLLGAVALVLAIGFFTAFRKTWSLYWQNKNFETQLSGVNSAPERIAVLRKQSATLDNVFSFSLQKADQRQELLQLASFASQEHNVLFKGMGQPEAFSNQGFLVETYTLVFQGGYKNMLSMLYDLESTLKSGKPMAAKFVSEKERGAKAEDLFCYLYIQSVHHGEN